MEYAYKPTTHGRAVMAACWASEKPLRITRVAFGSGKVSGDINLADVHALLSPVSDGAIADRSHEDDRLKLTLQYANAEHPEVKTFLLSEFMVYANDPETDTETDLLYGTLGDYRQPVPAYKPAFPPSVFNFPLELILSDEISVSVSAPAGLVTYDDLSRLLDTRAVGTSCEEVVIPVSGWQEDADTGGVYPLHYDIPVEGVTERVVPWLAVWPADTDTADACQLSGSARTIQDAVRVYAKTAPKQPIRASLTLHGTQPFAGMGTWTGCTLPPATAEQLGGVRVRRGSGLTVDADGSLSVDAASGSDAETLFDKV